MPSYHRSTPFPQQLLWHNYYLQRRASVLLVGLLFRICRFWAPSTARPRWPGVTYAFGGNVRSPPRVLVGSTFQLRDKLNMDSHRWSKSWPVLGAKTLTYLKFNTSLFAAIVDSVDLRKINHSPPWYAAYVRIPIRRDHSDTIRLTPQLFSVHVPILWQLERARLWLSDVVFDQQ